jgi:MscS family membrane protein
VIPLFGRGQLRDLLISLGILFVSYVVARFASFLFARALMSSQKGGETRLEDRLVLAVKRPLTYILFLIGAYIAIDRIPMPGLWIARANGFLYILTVLLLTVAVARCWVILLGWYTTRRSGEDTLSSEFGPLLNKIGSVAVAIVGSIVLLQHFNVNVASLVVSLGVGSLAVGLAAQDTLSNMFAGFALMLDRPFRVGDRIQLASGDVGDVVVVGMRSTRIKTLDETILIVPNSSLVKERLVNQTRPGRYITTRIELSMPSGSDLAKVKKILVDSALACPRVDPGLNPVALLTRLAEGGIVLMLVFWSRDYLEQGLARSDVLEEIHRRFQGAGIDVSIPVQRLIHEGVPLARGEG